MVSAEDKMNWDHPTTVARFVTNPPNGVLMDFVKRLNRRRGPLSILDIGCGAGRNAVPMALLGNQVTGVDRSQPMLDAARAQAEERGAGCSCQFRRGEMDQLPVSDRMFDLVVAHGVWNLAESDEQFLRSVSEAGRAARSEASLFLFTFAQLGPQAPSHNGSRFAAGANGDTRCYASEADLDGVLGSLGFVRPPGRPLTLYNEVRRPGSPPPIYEGVWSREIL